MVFSVSLNLRFLNATAKNEAVEVHPTFMPDANLAVPSLISALSLGVSG